MRARITRVREALRGALALPGDKSISHRRALLSLLTDGEVRLENFGTGGDCMSTLHCLQRLGKTVARVGRAVSIRQGARVDHAELDCGNSGTTARLLMGLLAALPGEWTLYGDVSLSSRPMRRVAEPLRLMGAQIELTDGHLPVHVSGGGLHGIEFDSPLASAQVKSAVLFAALKAEGETRYREPQLSRDHTERLLGLQPESSGWIVANSVKPPAANDLSATVPGDPSTAAFFVLPALFAENSELVIPGLLANPQRVAYAGLLADAGAEIEFRGGMADSLEPVAELVARSSTLRGLTLREGEAAAVIDEIPVLAVAAALTREASHFFGLGELRVKESDRLSVICDNLRRMGVKVTQEDDCIFIEGNGRLQGATIDPCGDHRIAMAFASAGLLAEGETVIEQAECVAVSYPEFWLELQRLAPGYVFLEDA